MNRLRRDYSDTWKKESREEKIHGSCAKCGFVGSLHAHHIIPLSKGGPNSKANRMLLCERCHTNQHSHMQKNKVKAHKCRQYRPPRG